MSNDVNKLLDLRPLITDTLPYEVPLIFSNDKFISFLSKDIDDDDLQKLRDIIIQSIGNRYTVPYNYEIRKNDQKQTTLSIIHPLMQIKIAEFYKHYADIILYHCAGSDYSLRWPSSVASIYSEDFDKDDDSNLKSGIVEDKADLNLPDLSHLVSYFVYEKYNLLNKFITSKEFLRHEKNYKFMKSLDISKCFYNIYTHSVTWAVKNKEFAKDNVRYYSFEGRLDKLMQLVNYNETNGIVVGPEFSRIFAEIILQDVDKKLFDQLEEEGVLLYRDYVIRRYIDDYFVFANNIDTINKIDDKISQILAQYKLYQNPSKANTSTRPFLTNISASRIEIMEIMSRLRNHLNDSNRGSIVVDRSLSKIRASIVRNNIEICNISASILTSSRNLIKHISGKIESTDDKRSIIKTVCSIIELIYYVCSLDLRVNTTYKIGQILHTIYHIKTKVHDNIFDDVEYLVENENIKLIKSAASRAVNNKFDGDYIELYNLLICTAHFHGKEFLSNSDIRSVLNKIMNDGRMTYFKFVVLKFCFLKNVNVFEKELETINIWAESCLSDKETLLKESERFLLLLDYISSPDVTPSKKIAVFTGIFGGNHSKKSIDALANIVGFSDWSGMRIHHLLCRKELRPVYS